MLTGVPPVRRDTNLVPKGKEVVVEQDGRKRRPVVLRIRVFLKFKSRA